MFSSLMPQRAEFFELLAAHSDRVVAGANATLRLMNGLGVGTEDIPVLEWPRLPRVYLLVSDF